MVRCITWSMCNILKINHIDYAEHRKKTGTWFKNPSILDKKRKTQRREGLREKPIKSLRAFAFFFFCPVLQRFIDFGMINEPVRNVERKRWEEILG